MVVNQRFIFKCADSRACIFMSATCVLTSVLCPPTSAALRTQSSWPRQSLPIVYSCVHYFLGSTARVFIILGFVFPRLSYKGNYTVHIKSALVECIWVSSVLLNVSHVFLMNAALICLYVAFMTCIFPHCLKISIFYFIFYLCKSQDLAAHDK